MEEVSTIVYQDKKIYLVDFSNCGKSREETLRLIKAAGDEFVTNPANSVLALLNVSNAYFHFETFKAFRNLSEKTEQCGKKTAIVGLKGARKAGFNSITKSSMGTIRAFDSEQEAKDWLVSD